MQDQAIRPSFYNEFTSKVDETLKGDDLKRDEDQAALAYITHYRGWQLLKEYKNRLEEFLDGSLSQAIASGAGRGEIGDRALIKEMAKYVLESFIAKAENARRIEEK